ncbi:DUF2088 domain-containing protein [Candidatus Magnetomoraceae bacterium gMMP-15]
MRYPEYIEKDFSFPEFFHVKMHYPDLRVKNIEKELISSLDKILPDTGIKHGDSVAVGVGSRGITNLPLIVKTLCRWLKQKGAVPFIIPAMGSHGGATEEGQRQILKSLGITKNSCGVPVLFSLKVKEIGSVFGEVPVFFSQDALKADHCVCINRFKPHTKFKAEIESGILKMLCVGMGKHKGALAFHNYALKYGFFPILKSIGTKILTKTNFRFGIGIVENAHDKIMRIEAILKEKIIKREIELLEIAKQNFPKLPVKHADVLIIQNIGKDISGSGMDPNVTGRAFDLKEDDFSAIFHASRIAILNLTKKTAGNGIGLGNADFITEKVYKNLNYETTLMNALTSMSLRKAFIPIRLPNDKKAIQACFTTLGPVDPKQIRAIIIKDTRHIDEFQVSTALYDEIKAISEAEILENIKLAFDSQGNLEI